MCYNCWAVGYKLLWLGLKWLWGLEIGRKWRPRGCHISSTSQPRQRRVVAMWRRGYHVSDTFLKHHHHVICHIIATSSSKSSLQVMWQGNPWQSLSSQILGFGPGSLGFTPIYDGLITSGITSIYDENVNTSREVICDAQSMTKWKFVKDIILWRKLDDPWWKSTVIDHKVFCSGWDLVRG
jgi:hypothetical protein